MNYFLTVKKGNKHYRASFLIRSSTDFTMWITVNGKFVKRNIKEFYSDDEHVILALSHDIEWKKKKYLQACRIMDRYIKKNNPCGIGHTKNRQVYCNDFPVNSDTDRLCCDGCACHSIEKGCKTQNLACKLFLCSKAKPTARYFYLVSIINKFFITHSFTLFETKFFTHYKTIMKEEKAIHTVISLLKRVEK